MYDRDSNTDRPARTLRLSRRSGLRLAGLGALLSVAGGGHRGVAAQDSSPVASPDAGCVADPVLNRASAARWFAEVLNEGNLDVLDELLDPDAMLDPAAFPAVTGVPRVRQVLGDVLTAFPDVSYTVEDTLIDGDNVVIRWTAAGTQQDDYAGISANGEAQRWSGIHFFHFVCGRITNIWAEADILAQLGLVEDVQATPTALNDATGSPGAGCATPSKAEMEGFAHAWQDVWNSHDVTTYEGVVSPDAVHHFGVRADAVGLPAIQHGLTGFFTAFPDLKGPIENIVVDG
ncbi:MAG TPA: ester cyclase, partial [Thermomicrobiales bacterium]|nr:ester cyclase [Thermomicrobiales bacterium]